MNIYLITKNNKSTPKVDEKAANASAFNIESDNTYKLFYLMSYGLDDVSKDKIDCMEAQKYFYGFTSVNHINNITVAAGDPDTGFADGYTRKIIDDEDNVQKIYKILSSSYCIEETVNDLIFSDNFSLSYLLENSMQVSIVGKDGSTSYSLYYYPSGHFFYEISNDLIYMVQSENDIKYLAEIFKINRHTEPSDPETWNLTLSCHEATESYVSLSIAPDANRNYYNLYIGADYTIEKLENDTWTNCPTKLSYQLYSDTYPFSTKISNSSTTMYTDFFTEEKYGRLQKGTYRITITVYDSNSTDLTNPSHRDFTTEFTIE